MTTSQVVTWAANYVNPRNLGQLGHISGLNWSFANPGGCDQMQCTLAIPPDYRTDAMDPGRIVNICRGGSVVWDGHMLEPVPTTAGWTITAVGTGSWATNYMASYSGSWGAGVADNAVNGAIARGLRWVNPGIDDPSGIWYGQEVDTASQTIADLLNLCCSNGGLTWYVGRGNVLSVYALPGTVNRLLVATSPVARTLGGNYNRIFERYAKTADTSGNPATYGTTQSDDLISQAKYGQLMEDYIDLSSVGVIGMSNAQAVGTAILKRYQRANYAGPYQITQGQLLTTGGQPIDLGTEGADTVCRLLMTDYAYGGEEIAQPVQFMTGNYSYDEDSQTATVTPFQAVFQDMSSLISAPGWLNQTAADKRYAAASKKAAIAAAAAAAKRKKKKKKLPVRPVHRPTR